MTEPDEPTSEAGSQPEEPLQYRPLQEAFQLAEYESLRREIDDLNRQMSQNIVLTFTAVGAMWAWVAKGPAQEVEQVAVGVAVLLPVALGLRALAMSMVVDRVGRHLHLLEEHFWPKHQLSYIDSQDVELRVLGWEHHNTALSEEKTWQLRVWRYGFYATLFVLSTVLAVATSMD